MPAGLRVSEAPEARSHAQIERAQRGVRGGAPVVNPKGYSIVMLHAHLPYVRHPEHPYFLEENWFYEAIHETYLPLLGVFEGLVRDGVPWKLTMSISPPLMEMMRDPLLIERTSRHLANLDALCKKEIVRTRDLPEFHPVVEHYRTRISDHLERFENRYDRDLVGAFKRFADLGHLEIVTCTGTHGFLPLMSVNRRAIAAQLRVAVETHERHLGRKPRGIWLAECGYVPGIDTVLAREGIEFFFVDTHGILHGTPRPKYGVYSPVYCPSGVAAFGRDVESSRQVWSAEVGYPGDPNYREYYRDIGWDLDLDYIRPHIHPDGLRINTGLKYYRITGRTDTKKPYNPERAHVQATLNASDFLGKRIDQVEALEPYMDGHPPVVVSPYDAELFGHWWYEGPLFLDAYLRVAAKSANLIRTTTPAEYLRRHPRQQVVTPSISSWGAQGYAGVWLMEQNDWIYRHLIPSAERMVELATQYASDVPLVVRALNQAARELLLAQSSDWAFIMKTGTMVEYAKKRTIDHVARFNHLYDDVKAGTIDETWLAELEYRDNIFPTIDYRVYAERTELPEVAKRARGFLERTFAPDPEPVTEPTREVAAPPSPSPAMPTSTMPAAPTVETVPAVLPGAAPKPTGKRPAARKRKKSVRPERPRPKSRK